uniref:helix-turn-helix domain-containing protein n=1 Tax=Okeania sp. SIO2F4 TaxID=2607790 RepID=UPI0025F583F2
MRWQIIVYSRSLFEFLAIIFLYLIAIIGCLIVGVYWLLQIARMLGYFLDKHKLQYSQVKTLIKITGVPILVFCYIFLAVYTDIIRLRLSEPALMNCVNNPDLCQEDTRIGFFYIQRISQGGGCTFFATDIPWVFDESGIVYIPESLENCVYVWGELDNKTKIYKYVIILLVQIGIMKARFKYRIYPTPGQKYRLAKLFGCVRVV